VKKVNKEQIGKYLSLILRHKPETIGIELDSHGWASVDELIDGVKKTYPEISFAFLKEIVSSDNKQRYSFNDDKTKIRANQGHSISVDLELKPVCPPDILYHGTGEKYVNSIDSEGLIKKSRQYVHLSADTDTAKKVGIRHGKPVIYSIDSKKMYEEGYSFYLSENGVWLTNDVPVQYLKKVNN
jgi:putative RNA 2'-phosphotransferase